MSQDKTLSQKEIDALLAILPSDGAALPGTGPDTFLGSARAYDFRSPDKFSKEQIRTLQMIHENFARRLTSSLSAFLRATVSVALVHVEQGSFVDFLQNIPSPSPTTVFKYNPLPGRVMLAFDTDTASIAIDRLMGGLGQPTKDEHEITDIDQRLIETLIDYISDAIEDAWRNVQTVKVEKVETTLNPEFAQVALPTDAAVFIGFEVRIRENTGMMSVCIPYSVLKPIINELSPHSWVAGENRVAEVYKDSLESHMQSTEVDLRTLLGEVEVNFEDVLQLQVGDVLVLDSQVDRPLPILVGENKQYHGNPGLLGRQLAVQISDIIERGKNG